MAGSSAAPDHTVRTKAIAPVTIRIPIHFFIFSVIWFACGSCLMPWLAPEAIRSSYQPAVLSLVHIFTLGFITSAMMGVMYRYVPAVTGRPVFCPRLAMPQFAAYAIGVMGMISHFALGSWSGLWWSAAVVLASIILFAINLLPPLWSGLGRGVVETGMFASVCFLFVAASLGLLMGIEEMHGFVFGNLLTSLAGHITFAAIGWVALTICAASYRFISAFVLAKDGLPRIALWQIVALAVGTLGLGTSFIFGLPGTFAWSAIVAGTLIAYAMIIATLVRGRQTTLDWGVGHALAGVLWLIVAIALGQVVAWSGGWSAAGVPYADALATAALLGWAGNFIIGMSYRLLPGFVGRVRTVRHLPALTIADLSVPGFRPFILFAFNAAIVAIAIAFVIKTPELGAVGGWSALGAAVPYTVMSFWTLSYAYR